MCRSSRTNHLKRRGQALLESSLVLSVFVTTFMGVMDMGQLLFTRTSLVERVRYSIRRATVLSYNEGTVQNLVMYGKTTPPGDGSVDVPGYLGLTRNNVQVTRHDVGTEGDRITVRIVNYDYRFFSPWINGTFQDNLAVVETIPYEYQ